MFAYQALAVASLALPFASAAVIDVFVGGDAGLVFSPNSVTANPGDSIRFTFGTKNHTVTQSTFASPCTLKPGGFFSGYMPVPAGQTEGLPEFYIPVPDSNPIWAFCSQANHCEQGMVFAVNAPAAPAANSFSNYQSAALALGGGSAAPAASASTSAAAAAAPAATTGVPDNAASGGSDYGSGYGSGYGAGSGSAVTTSAPAPTASGNAAAAVGTTGTVHTIVVGGSAGTVYTPNNIQAAPGDVVQFQFQVKNHTVTQSTFANPCSAEAGGFDSGFMPVAATTTSGFPTYSITVNDTKPIWGYCRQSGHCQAGMVFAINVNATSPNTFAAFQAAAKGSSSSTASSSAAGASGTSKPTNGAVGSNAKLGMALFAAVSLGFGVLL